MQKKEHFQHNGKNFQLSGDGKYSLNFYFEGSSLKGP